MKKATPADKMMVVNILAKAFDANLSVNYIIKQDSKRVKRIQALMEYSFTLCICFGEVFISDDNKACALILYPQLKKTTLLSVWLDIILIFKAIGVTGISKAMKREILIRKKQAKERMNYLWFIGVDPEYQHHGTGSRLLQDVIIDAQEKNLPIYLETSTKANLPWYKGFNFIIYDELLLIDYVLHFLKLEPSN